MTRYLSFPLLCGCLIGCGASLVPGPDRQFEEALAGAATGAGAGAVTGFQVGAGTGPGAFVGAGVGAVAGGLQGLVDDQVDETTLSLDRKMKRQKERVWAQEVLNDQWKRRLEIHPTREIYPADLFFWGDRSEPTVNGKILIREIAGRQKQRLPWSALVVAAYVKSDSQQNRFARYLAERRARELADEMVRAGIEPRRVQARAVLIESPLVLDPLDRTDRYNQAIEIIPVNR